MIILIGIEKRIQFCNINIKKAVKKVGIEPNKSGASELCCSAHCAVEVFDESKQFLKNNWQCRDFNPDMSAT